MKRSVALVLAVMVPGCAPVFSDLQSAKLAGKGRVDVTPGFSSVSSSDDGGSGHVQNHAGIQVAESPTASGTMAASRWPRACSIPRAESSARDGSRRRQCASSWS